MANLVRSNRMEFNIFVNQLPYKVYKVPGFLCFDKYEKWIQNFDKNETIQTYFSRTSYDFEKYLKQLYLQLYFLKQR